ncbi:MAG: trypsin-like peptidase domain-containing protein [Gammaproteobacteria bacterium]
MDRFFQSLVRVLSDDQQPPDPVGVGFMVSEKHVISCAHVIADALKISRTKQEKPAARIWLDRPLTLAAQPLSASVEVWHPLNERLQFGELEDLAVLTLDAPLALPTVNIQSLPLTDFIDRPVRLFGFPKGKDNGTWITGQTKGPLGNGWIQLDNELGRHGVTPGFSGAPVWDDQTQAIVGMMVGTPKGDPHTAYMVPVVTLAQAWSFLISSPDSATEEPVMRFDFSGTNQLEFCRRLSHSWRDLATILEIPSYEQARFDRGDEGRGIWNWLAAREELVRLPPALEAIDRADLARIFAPAKSPAKMGASLRVSQTKRKALEQQLQSLEEDYQAVSEQRSYALNAADKNKLKRQAESIEREMEQIQHQLDGLG